MGRLFQKTFFFILCACLLVISTSLVYILLSTGSTVIATRPIQRSQISRTAVPTMPPVITSTPAIPLTAQKPCQASGRAYEMGVAFPQWTPQGYGGTDTSWLTELPHLKSQTASCWVEMPVLLYQSSFASTIITTGPSTPTLAALTYGIQYAHALGLHVFVTMLMGVGGNNGAAWAGSIKLNSLSDEQAWFTSYWHALQPYAAAAAQAKADQFGVATEEAWLQANSPNLLWNTLIANVHSVFAGPLVYDMNWTSLGHLVPAWMFNPLLKMIGISAYLPSTTISTRLTEEQIAALWVDQARPELDKFAQTIGEPIFLSEIGYRDSSDALYRTWQASSSAPVDPAEQAAACQAALETILPDQNIVGNFFWGWDSSGAFDLKGSPAASIIQQFYQSLQK